MNTLLVGLHHSSCVVKSVQVMAVYGDLKQVICEYGSHLNGTLKNKQLQRRHDMVYRRKQQITYW